MCNKPGNFDDIPRYLLNTNLELKRCAVDMLTRELERRKVRRPWGSIEPFIVALYHVVFVDRDREVGKLLLNYLDRILPKVKNTLHSEVREAADIILYAARSEIGEIDKNVAIAKIQKYKPASPISELVKRVVTAELRGKYDEQIDELLKKINDEIEQRLWYLRTLLEEPIGDILLDLDMAQARSIYNIREYFIYRARELKRSWLPH